MSNFGLQNIIVKTVAILGIIIVSFIVFFEIWISDKTKWVHAEVRPALRKVYYAYICSRITGTYWENIMLEQGSVIDKLPAGQRVEFYREIVVNIYLDTSRAYLFIEMVDGDIKPLHTELTKLTHSDRYNNIPVNKREEVVAWIGELEKLSKREHSKKNQ